MEVKELKRELSKVSGVDFFSPKYRSIFKRFAGDDKATEAEEPEEAEDIQAEDVQIEEEVETTEVAGDEEKDNTQETEGETPDIEDTAEDEAETTEEVNNDDTNNQDLEADEEESSESTEDEPEVETEEEVAQSPVDMNDELLTTKLELELVKAGIREDRLETAKRLFMPEFKDSGGNTEQIRELIAQYPEWIGKQGGAQGFGMPLGDKADALSNEEKALKRMGIDPRN